MGTHSHHKRAGAQTTHDEEDAGEEFWNTLNKFSKNPDRPRRNNYCIIGGFLAGLATVAGALTSEPIARDQGREWLAPELALQRLAGDTA